MATRKKIKPHTNPCSLRSGAITLLVGKGADPTRIVGGTATAGDSGTATAGDSGTVQVRWWDDQKERYRTITGYVREDGIEPWVFYRVTDGKLTKDRDATEAEKLRAGWKS